jgi:hypothetical protein
MAAPHVTGTVALMLANDVTGIRQILHDTAIDLGAPGVDGYFGYGLVQAKPAVLGEDTLAPVVTFLSPEHESEVYGTVGVELDIQDEHIVTIATLLIDGQKVVEWTQGPFVYEWDSTQWALGEHMLTGQATDNSENVGQAEIRLTVLETTLSPTPTATSTAEPTKPGKGNLKETGPSEPKPTKTKEPGPPDHAKSTNAPEVTNIDQRNTTPAPTEEDITSEPTESEAESTAESQSAVTSEPSAAEHNLPEYASDKAQGKGHVKGTSSVAWWDMLVSLVRALF